MLAEVLLNGDVKESAPADNTLASVSRGGAAAQRHFVGGLEAHYSAAVAAIKTITLSRTVNGVAVNKTYKWDFAKGPFVHNFPLLVHGDYGTDVIATLDASGTPGVVGTVAIWTALV